MLSRREFILISQLLAAHRLLLTVADSHLSAQEDHSQAEWAQINSAIKKSMEVVSEVLRHASVAINQVEQQLSSLTDRATTLGVGWEAAYSVPGYGLAFGVGIVASIDSTLGEIEVGPYLNVTRLVAAEVQPSLAFGPSFSIGRGSLDSFYGSSTVQGLTIPSWTGSLTTNPDYLGVSGGPAGEFSRPSYTRSTESETYGANLAVKIEVSKSMSAFMDYLWSAAHDPSDDAAPPW